MTFTPVGERLVVELSLATLTTIAVRFEHPTFHMRGEGSSRLRQRRCNFIYSDYVYFHIYMFTNHQYRSD